MADYDLGTARGKIEIDSSGAEDGALRAGKSVSGLQGNLDKASGSMLRTGAVLGGIGVAAVAGFGVAINASANFEKRISAIGAVTQTSGTDLDKFRQLALQLGADTAFSAGEAAMAIEELAKAGIPLPDILGGAAAAVTDLAAAGEVDLARAAEITANSMNLFAISGENASHVADVFAQAAGTSSAGVEDLGMALSQVGGVAKLVGLSFEDTINSLSQMADAGYKGSDAGTSVKAMLLSLQPSTKQQIELFDRLGITTEGMNNRFFDAQGNLKPLVAIQEELQRATAGMTREQRTATLEQIGGTDAIRALGVMVDGTTAKTTEYGNTLNKQGAAQETAKARLDNLKGSMEQFKGSMETALIQIGKLGQGPVRSVIDFLTKMVNGFLNLSPAMQQFIIMGVLITGVLVGLAGVFLLVGGGILKLITTFRELKAAFTIIKEMQLLTKATQALNASFLANPIVLIIAGLVLLGAALFVAYKKSESFRNVVNTIGRAFKYVYDSFVQFVNAFRGAGDVFESSGFMGFMEKAGILLRKIFDFVVNNWPLLIAVFLPFLGIPILIIKNWSTIVNFFQSLPGIVGGFLLMLVTKAIDFGVQFLAAVVNFLLQLPGKFVEAFAFIIGFWIGFQIRMLLMALEFGAKFIAAIIDFIIQLPGRLLDIFTTVTTNTASWIVDMLGKAVDLGARFLNAIVEFFSQLPGRIWDFLTAAASNTASWVVDMVGKAVDMGSRFLNTIVEWFQQLPGRVQEFISDTFNRVISWANDMVDRAREMATNIYNGVRDGLEGLPGIVGGILGRVIDAIKGAIRNAFNAVKDFAANMWDGFKKGLGIGSPSLIEYAMWDLVDNVTDSTKDLRKQIMQIQKMSAVNFGEFGPTLNGQSASAVTASAGTMASGITSAASNFASGVQGAVNTFHNTFNTDADPTQISQQIMWDQRIRIRGG